jgi:TonB family protein
MESHTVPRKLLDQFAYHDPITRSRRLLAVPFLKTPVRYNLRTSPPKITRVVAAITQLVQDSIDSFQGPDIQSVARQQRYAVGRLFLCNKPQLPPSPDCNLSDEDFQKKHPIPLGSPSPADPKRPSTAVLVYPVEPQYPTEARATKLGGTVTVGMTVDTQGVSQNLQIAKSRGAALDQAALNAVGQYRFEPAHDATGIPVEMRVNVDVDFQIF